MLSHKINIRALMLLSHWSFQCFVRNNDYKAHYLVLIKFLWYETDLTYSLMVSRGSFSFGLCSHVLMPLLHQGPRHTCGLTFGNLGLFRIYGEQERGNKKEKKKQWWYFYRIHEKSHWPLSLARKGPQLDEMGWNGPTKKADISLVSTDSGELLKT